MEKRHAITAVCVPLSISRNDSRAGAGVYFLVKGDEVVYVGSSVNVLERVSKHASGSTETDKDFDGSFAVFLPERDIRWAEACLINSLKPTHNRQVPRLINGFRTPFGTSQDAKELVQRFCFIGR